jgi:hypothetical protein
LVFCQDIVAGDLPRDRRSIPESPFQRGGDRADLADLAFVSLLLQMFDL